MTITPEDIARVSELLQREPRGLAAIPVRASNGDPAVIRVDSLVDGKPFPTLFWLVDGDLSYRIDRVEAAGLIKQLQARIDASPELVAAMERDHRAHIDLRNSFLTAQQKQALEHTGYYAVLQQRGIGGIADFQRIRCLHTWYAAHLVVPNTVGRLLDDHWAGETGG